MTEKHDIKLTFGLHPRDTRLWIDGHEVTHQIRELTIHATVGEEITDITIMLNVLNLGEPIVVHGGLIVEPGALDGIV